MGILHACTVYKVIDINTENKMPVKQGIHMWLLMIYNRYDCQMHLDLSRAMVPLTTLSESHDARGSANGVT